MIFFNNKYEPFVSSKKQMISTRYISFLSGIVIASLTWAFSLYLYSKLSSNIITADPTTMSAPGASARGENNYRDMMLRDNVVIPRNEKQVLIAKNVYQLNDDRDRRNNLQHFQPIPVKPAVTLDQGNSRDIVYRLACNQKLS